MKKATLALVSLVITAIPAFSQELPPPAPAQTTKGRYWFFADKVKPVDDSAEIMLWIALPPNHPGQDVEIIHICPEPEEIIEDTLSGNRVVFWRITSFEDKNILFYYDFVFSRWEVRTDVDPDSIADYDTTSVEYMRYTASEPWIELTDDIRAKAYEIVGVENNPYYQARKIYDWTIDNMVYKYPDINERGAEKSFYNLKGDCGEFSVVFCALCRSVGIPARTVTCVWLDRPGHQWAEILLPGYGWVPVDPSIGQVFTGKSTVGSSKEFLDSFAAYIGMPTLDYNYFFGNLYTERLIVSVGNNIEVSHPDLGISKTFRFMQPGGYICYPPSVENNGLSGKVTFSGTFMFGEDAGNFKIARKVAKPYMVKLGK
ncbi:transglutaminase domain-containing protein [candidate division WOR-3 bacterium]|nr:transglutaminase domain-containing protein [candidate division WOR-3 bacterium]